MKINYNAIIAFLILSFLLLSLYAFSQEAQAGDEDGFRVIKGSYVTIYMEDTIDIRKLHSQIDVGFARYDPVEKGLFLDRGISDDQKLANKIDVIIRKAQKILDMYPGQFRVNLKIYETEKGLRNAYKDIFREERDHKAFYVHKLHTIFVSKGNASTNILAHEIGHSIIDNYFSILPPPKIAELLACYVDVHIQD